MVNCSLDILFVLSRILRFVSVFLGELRSYNFDTKLSKFWCQIRSILEKAMAPHSSTLAWKIPWAEEPGGLQSMGSQSRTERLHFDFSLSCTGEGNGNPLQCSCLENPRDGAAWWAAVYRVAESDTTEATQQQQQQQLGQSYLCYFCFQCCRFNSFTE